MPGSSITLAGGGRKQAKDNSCSFLTTCASSLRRSCERDSGPWFLPVDPFRSPFRGNWTPPARRQSAWPETRESNLTVPGASRHPGSPEGLSSTATWGKQVAFHRGVLDFEEYGGNAVCSFYLPILLFYYIIERWWVKLQDQTSRLYSLWIFVGPSGPGCWILSLHPAESAGPRGFPQHPGLQTDQRSYPPEAALASYAGKASQPCTHDDNDPSHVPFTMWWSAGHVQCFEWTESSHPQQKLPAAGTTTSCSRTKTRSLV